MYICLYNLINVLEIYIFIFHLIFKYELYINAYMNELYIYKRMKKIIELNCEEWIIDRCQIHKSAKAIL